MRDGLEAQTALVRFALAGAGDDEPRTVDLTAEVRACPGWDVHGVVTHLGAVHRWAAGIVEAADPTAAWPDLDTALDSAPAPTEGPLALADWYSDSAAWLLDVIDEADPDAPAWTFGDPQAAGFWLRRQLHETVVHRWDVESALTGPGSTTPVPDEIALDGLVEFRDVIAIRAARKRRGPAPVTVVLRPEVEGDDDPEFTLSGADGAPVVTVSGPVESVLLLLWGRLPVDDPHLDVDRPDELRAVLAEGLAL